jgi:hypothetical protein
LHLHTKVHSKKIHNNIKIIISVVKTSNLTNISLFIIKYLLFSRQNAWAISWWY